MNDACNCNCGTQDFGDCGTPGGTLIDPTGVTVVDPSGVHGCIADDMMKHIVREEHEDEPVMIVKTERGQSFDINGPVERDDSWSRGPYRPEETTS